jgi:hypothetical protein
MTGIRTGGQMARNDYMESVKDEILTALSDGPLTLRQLELRLSKPYNTVQKAHQMLRDENRVVSYDRRARGGKWALGAHNGPRTTIPSISFNGDIIKMTKFTGTTAIPHSMEEAANTVIRAWVTCAMTAQRLNNGVPDNVLTKRLKRQKAQLLEAREAFETMAFFCTQMMNDPKFWELEALTEYVNDKDWKEFQPFLEQMYDHYYGVED